MNYKVKLDKLRVIAWVVLRDQDGDVYMNPVTLPLDPRDQDESQRAYINVTGEMAEDENRRVKPHDVLSVIPATATSWMKLVLCRENGDEVTTEDGQRLEYALGFFTSGTEHEPIFEEWRKEAEADPAEYFYQLERKAMPNECGGDTGGTRG